MTTTAKLHQYQKRAVEFNVTRRSVFNMLDAGMGKTAIALKTIERVGKPAIVIAPLRVCHITWPDEIKKWTPNLTYTILHGPDKNKKLKYRKMIYIINYEGLKWFYRAVRSGEFKARQFFLVLDESSFVKNPSTQRFKILKKLLPLWSPYRLCLSATPAPNGYHELWPQYFCLDQGKRLGATFYSYRNTYFTYSGAPYYKTTLDDGCDKKIQAKVKDITYRLESTDHIDMPDLIRNKIYLKLPEDLQKQYDRLERDFFLEIEDADVEVFSAATLSMKLRQFMQGAMYIDTETKLYKEVHTLKIQALKELLEGSAGQPILCPIQFHFEVDMINKYLRKNVPVIHGKTPNKTANNYIRQWNKGDLPLLLCHPRSVGYGMNLQAAGHIVLWFGLTWSLEQYFQLNARLWRQGQKQTVILHHLMFKNTIDDTVFKALNKKEATQGQLLDALKAACRARRMKPAA